MLMNPNRRFRRAIGLVELMVAMALSIGIMYILAESFKMGLDFTRNARSTGNMMSQLDSARAVLARDILAEHFLRDENKPNGGVRLSDQRLDFLNNAGAGWTPPTGGFFRIISPASTFETFDSDGFAINSARNHALHFTAILPVADQNLYTANSPAGTTTTYASRAAEVAYFLVDSGLTTSPGGGQKLYHLIRRQRLVALTGDETASLLGAANDPEVVASNGTNTVYTLDNIRDPSLRLNVSPSTMPGGGTPPPYFGPGNARYGEDLVLSNVLSFEVLVDWSQSAVTNSSLAPRQPPINWDAPFDTLAVNAGQNSTFTNMGLFDTWYPVANWNNFALANNAAALPLAVRVKQIQVITRVWDSKTKMARQSTWKFAM